MKKAFLTSAAVITICQSAAFSSDLVGSPRLLSVNGSDRATAYVESAKIIRFGQLAHVAWLDETEEGFSVRVQTTDTNTGWSSPVFTIGEAQDNHGGPALTVDAEGYLHVLYYPHHSPMRYRRSVRPNDGSEWTPVEKVGVDLTYPAVVCAKDGTLIMVARRSFDDRPWDLELWRKAPGKAWARKAAVLHARYGKYAQFAASLAWGSDHSTLHLAARIYEKGEWDGQEEPTTTVGYLRSENGGESWTKSDGSPVALPATAETIELIAAGERGDGSVYAIGSMAVGPDDLPYIPYSVRKGGSSDAFLASPTGEGAWRRTHLNPYLPDGYEEWDLFMLGGVSFGASGEALVATTALPLEREDLGWGEPETELALFRSSNGEEGFRAEIVGSPDPTTLRWLPNLERPTGFNRMPTVPSLIYTEGSNGESGNRVYWLRND